MKRNILIFILFLLAVTAANVFAGGNKELLVDTDWLEKNLDRNNVVVLETGRDLETFREGHIPNSIHVERSTYYGTLGDIPGMFADPEGFIAYLNEIGITNRKKIVIYDNSRALWATRLFWSLEYVGHDRVKVLDGGLAKWKAEGRQLETGDSIVTQDGNFKPSYRNELLVDADWVEQNIDNQSVDIIDTRSIGEYVGTDVRSARGGHIPNSEHIEWTVALTDTEPYVFLPTEELRELYESNEVYATDSRIVALCQTGVRGAHTYFVLRLLGYDNVAVYDGSWAEWGNDERYPIVSSTLEE